MLINKRLYKIKQRAVLLLCALLAGSFLGGCMNTTTATTATTEATQPTEPTQPTRPAETTLVLQLEGNEEKVAAKLFMSDLGYSMYLETSSYEYSVTDSQIDTALKADRFTPVEALDNDPDMYLEIGHLDNITKDAALALMKNQLTGRFPSLEQDGDIGVGVNKLDALVLRGINGSDWDSEAFMSAVFSDGGQGVYYYIIRYYFQAAEGFASRFNQYLDTFRIE